MEIFNTIVPIFTVIFLGWIAHQKGFFPKHFVDAANRLVFYIAIPAMIFRAISRASFHQQFSLKVLVIAVFSMTAVYLLSWMSGLMLKMDKNRLGTFIQSSFHCNIGYIAFAVAYYYLGDDGLAATGLFAGFMMILQNFYSVTALTICSGLKRDYKGVGLSIIFQVLLNPIILSAGLGILFSLAQIPLPVVVLRSIDILGGLGLPMALLIIGASLSFGSFQTNLFAVATACVFKLMVLPGLALLLYHILKVPGSECLPVLIILASPTATVSYVMAGEMGGDTKFAATAISLCTILSAVTFLIWLNAT